MISDEFLGLAGNNAREFNASQVECHGLQVDKVLPFEPCYAINKVAMGKEYKRQSLCDRLNMEAYSTPDDSVPDDSTLKEETSSSDRPCGSALIELGIRLKDSRIELDFCSKNDNGKTSIYEICREIDGRVE